MNSLNIILALSWNNLKTLQSRLGASLVIVVGIGGVVAVLIALLAMAKGFQATLQETGRTDRALILRAGSNSEINGNIALQQHAIISLNPSVVQADGEPLASMETFANVKLPDRASGELTSIAMRGVNQASFNVRPELKIVQGRMIDPGKFELLAGVGAARLIKGLEIGNALTIKGTTWQVVGHFATDASAYESEIWVGERLLAQLHGRGGTFSSMLVQLTSADAFAPFKAELENDKRLTVRALRESDYYSAQSKSTTQLITAVGIVIGCIMSIGAIFAALNTMYAAVSTRTVEIATLRALGFKRFPIFVTVITEALMLALVGGVVGGALSYLALNGRNAATVGGSYAQVDFAFAVTPDLLMLGITIALTLGLIGGTIPAVNAVRLSIVDGLKKL